MAAPPPPPVDPRNVVTEDAFRLDPTLLGTPLARPWRRAAAMSVDGIAVAILANAPGFLFALAAALVLFRASAGSARGGFFRRTARLSFRLGAAVVLFALAISAWETVRDVAAGIGSDEEESPIRVDLAADEDDDEEGIEVTMEGLGGLAMAADVIALTRGADDVQARARARRVVDAMRANGMEADEIREVLDEVGASSERPWLAAVADSVLGAPEPGASTVDADSLVARLAEAVEAGDTAAAGGLRTRVAGLLAADTLAELQSDLAAARRDRARLSAELERAEEEAEEGGGVLRLLRSLADDLGLGFGWSGLYFTTCLALWRGQTLGKRLLRVRVIRLDGRPLGWWMSFERFGGYAASLATGLLGFVQILWDRNRQGIHDKIAETVVVHDS